MSRAQQLPLTFSVADSARLRLDCELADAYGREQHDRVLELAEENDTLSDALEAAEARVRDLEGALRCAQTMVQAWRAQAQLLRRRADLPVSRSTPLDKDTLTALLKLAHPDRWENQPATTLAHEISIVLNDLRSSRLGVV